MIFIYELQKPIKESTHEDYKSSFALIEASNQYKFLYKLDITLLEKIEDINFIYKEEIQIKYYKKTFSDYSPAVSHYENQPKLVEKIFENKILPSLSEIVDTSKRTIIENLIRNQKLIKISVIDEYLNNILPEHELMIFLPFKGDLTTSLLQAVKTSENLNLFSNSAQMKIKGIPDVYEISSDLYLEIFKKLQASIPVKEGNFSGSQYYFRAKNLLEIFNESLLSELTYVEKEDQKRLQLFGADFFLATRVINHVLRSFTPSYFNLRKGISQVSFSDEPLVLTHLEAIDEIEDHKKLFEKIRGIDFLTYIILHSSRKIISPYFVNYYAIELPTKEIIDNSITSIVIALLVEKNLLSGEDHNLIPILQNNSFSILLREYNDLDSLYRVFTKLQNLTIGDLFNNTEMWYYIINELRRIANGELDIKIPSVKSKINFEYIPDGKTEFWSITGLGRAKSFEYAKTIGIKYIAIIIYYYQLTKKSIDVSLLRVIAHNLDNEVTQKFLDQRDYDTDRKAILDGLSRVKKDYEFKDFCNEFIRYSKSEYWYDSKNEINCKINHPKFNENFFSKFIK